jgi:hypothetical protein
MSIQDSPSAAAAMQQNGVANVAKLAMCGEIPMAICAVCNLQEYFHPGMLTVLKWRHQFQSNTAEIEGKKLVALTVRSHAVNVTLSSPQQAILHIGTTRLKQWRVKMSRPRRRSGQTRRWDKAPARKELNRRTKLASASARRLVSGWSP